MNTIIGDYIRPELMFKTMTGWTTMFYYNGVAVGGELALDKDPRVYWQLNVIDGVRNKTILELGPLEGGHTKIFVENGAAFITAVEGSGNCWLRCLIVKEAYGWNNVRFIFSDFNDYVAQAVRNDKKFDIVCCNGMLYHQLNPAELIHNIGKITDTVLIWSQVADELTPTRVEGTCSVGMRLYRGKMNRYGERTETFMGGLNDTALWLYSHELIRCFKDAGFTNIIQKEVPRNIHGESLLFVAKKA